MTATAAPAPMYCRVLACDDERTCALDGRLAPEVATAVADARRHGVVAVLVSSRGIEELREAPVDLFGFDAVVAENGAVVWLHGGDRVVELGGPPPERFLGELRRRGIPFHAGRVIVGTAERHAADVLALLRAQGVDAQLVFDRASAFVMPAGVGKVAGVRRALLELGRSERSMVAFGDAESDQGLFAAAELGVAAQGAVPALAAAADERLSQPGGVGVAAWIQRMLVHEAIVPTPPRRRIRCGVAADGTPATLPASGTDILVSGDPKAGKSWLMGLLAERLLEQGYTLLVIDPEGDHVALATRPGVVGFGLELPLPPPETVARLLRQPTSVVVHLARHDADARAAYVAGLLGRTAAVRARTGLPHWTVVDEAHCWLGEGAPALDVLAAPTGNCLLATYRPSMLAAAVMARIGAHVILPTTVEEERYVVAEQLRHRGPERLSPEGALEALVAPHAGLLVRGSDEVRWEVFRPERRAARLAPEPRRPGDVPVSETQAFRFVGPDGATVGVARDVAAFAAAVRTVPAGALRRHLLASDFSAWAAAVLRDDALARGLRKLEAATRAGAPASRAEILRHLAALYLV